MWLRILTFGADVEAPRLSYGRNEASSLAVDRRPADMVFGRDGGGNRLTQYPRRGHTERKSLQRRGHTWSPWCRQQAAGEVTLFCAASNKGPLCHILTWGKKWGIGLITHASRAALWCSRTPEAAQWSFASRAERLSPCAKDGGELDPVPFPVSNHTPLSGGTLCSPVNPKNAQVRAPTGCRPAVVGRSLSPVREGCRSPDRR